MSFYFQKIVEDRESERLDKFLRRKYPDLRLSALQKFIRLGKVYVDGERVKNGATRLKSGQSVLVKIPLSQEDIEKKYARGRPTHLPISLDLKIIYEDDYMLVLNKEPGIPVQPGKRTSNFSIYNALLSLKRHFFLVHRLDKYTSGVLIVSKDYEFTKKMAEIFKNHLLHKSYLALVHGLITKEKKIDEPLDGKEAFTFIKPIEFFTGLTLLEVEITTGRKHQIRRHLALNGTPIIGDDIYGNRRENSEFRKHFKLKGYFLHCKEISFRHPILKREIILEAPLPERRREIIKKLKNY